MNNYDEKILTIKETEKQLLAYAKDKISENNSIFNDNIGKILNILQYDSTMVKKYEAIIDAQNLIKKLANEIKEATSVEEIVNIRKKLNYYINKIKNIIKDRGILTFEYEKYVNNAVNLRKGISEYIRYLKREDKIKEIELLSTKSDLTEEESIRFKKLIKNELSYGKRNLVKNTKPITENIVEEKPVIKKITRPGSRYIKDLQEIEEDTDATEEEKNDETEISGSRYIKGITGTIVKKDTKAVEKRIGTKYLNDVLAKGFKKNDDKETKPIEVKGIKPINRTVIREVKTYDSLYAFLDDKVSDFAERYKIVTPENYTKNMIKNIVIFTKNLPTIIKNKSKVKYMAGDYVLYRRRPELSGYLEYVRRDNALLNNIKKAFAGSSLKNKEEYYQQEHQKCINWIIQFFKDNDIECQYNGLV